MPRKISYKSSIVIELAALQIPMQYLPPPQSHPRPSHTPTCTRTLPLMHAQPHIHLHTPQAQVVANPQTSGNHERGSKPFTPRQPPRHTRSHRAPNVRRIFVIPLTVARSSGFTTAAMKAVLGPRSILFRPVRIKNNVPFRARLLWDWECQNRRGGRQVCEDPGVSETKTVG